MLAVLFFSYLVVCVPRNAGLQNFVERHFLCHHIVAPFTYKWAFLDNKLLYYILWKLKPFCHRLKNLCDCCKWSDLIVDILESYIHLSLYELILSLIRLHKPDDAAIKLPSRSVTTDSGKCLSVCKDINSCRHWIAVRVGFVVCLLTQVLVADLLLHCYNLCGGMFCSIRHKITYLLCFGLSHVGTYFISRNHAEDVMCLVLPWQWIVNSRLSSLMVWNCEKIE